MSTHLDSEEFEDLSPGAIHSSQAEFARRSAAEKGEPLGDGLDEARGSAVADFTSWSEEELEADPMTVADEAIDDEQEPTFQSQSTLSGNDADFTLQQPLTDEPENDEPAEQAASANTSRTH